MKDRRTFTLSAQQHQVSDLTAAIRLPLSGRTPAPVSVMLSVIVSVFEPSAARTLSAALSGLIRSALQQVCECSECFITSSTDQESWFCCRAEVLSPAQLILRYSGQVSYLVLAFPGLSKIKTHVRE